MWLNIACLCALLGYCCGFARFKRWPIEMAPLVSITGIISFLYLAAFVGLLTAATYLVFAIGWALLLFSPAYIRVNKQQLFQCYITPTMLFWLVLVLFFAYYAKHTLMHHWDDFGEWGENAKALFFNQGFPTRTDYGVSKNFPPGMDLWYNFFLLFGHYTSATLYFAQTVLLLSPLPIIFSKQTWLQWKIVLSAFILLIIFFILVYNVHLGAKIGLDPDEIIGLLFGSILSIYYISEKKPIDFIILLPIMFCLMLLKPWLLSFALLITVLVMVDQLYRNLSQVSSTKLVIVTKSIVLPGSLLLIALLATFSWSLHLQHAHILANRHIANPLKFKQIAKLLTGTWSHYQILVLQQFFSLLIGVLINIIPVITFMITAFFLISTRRLQKLFILWQAILAFGFCAYLVGILLLYLFSFAHMLGLINASLVRYAGIYLTGWSVFLLAIIFVEANLHCFKVPQKLNNALLSSALIGLIVLGSVWGLQLEQQRQSAMGNYLRSVAKQVAQHTASDAHILIMTRGLTSGDRVKLYYWLIPHKLTPELANRQITYPQKWSIDQYLAYQYVLLIDWSRQPQQRVTRLFSVGKHGFVLSRCITANRDLCSHSL